MMELGGIPEVLQGRFRIEAKLAQGGQARTFLARDEETGAQVVVKVLLVSHVEDWKAVELFEREANILEQLQHPAIPAYLDAFHLDLGDAGEAFFLVQEHVDGETLRAQLDAGRRITEDTARDMMEQVLEILAHLQSLHPPVIHRDIKPSNLIMRPNGQVVLIDFGAIQAALTATQGSGGSTVVGTSGYMAPEQLMGRAVPATDLYGLGATMIHLLGHVHPSDMELERMTLRYRDHVRVSQPLQKFLDRLIAPNAEDRFADAAEALAALRAPVRAPQPAPARPARSGGGGAGAAILAGGIVALVGIVGMVALVGGSDEDASFDEKQPAGVRAVQAPTLREPVVALDVDRTVQFTPCAVKLDAGEHAHVVRFSEPQGWRRIRAGRVVESFGFIVENRSDQTIRALRLTGGAVRPDGSVDDGGAVVSVLTGALQPSSRQLVRWPKPLKDGLDPGSRCARFSIKNVQLTAPQRLTPIKRVEVLQRALVVGRSLGRNAAPNAAPSIPLKVDLVRVQAATVGDSTRDVHLSVRLKPGEAPVRHLVLQACPAGAASAGEKQCAKVIVVPERSSILKPGASASIQAHLPFNASKGLELLVEKIERSL